MRKPKETTMRTLARGARLGAFALALATAGSAWAATPLAVWNGDFNTATTRNGVTFSANDNTVNADGSVTIGNSKGIVFTAPKEYAYITAVFTVSNVVETTEADRILVSFANGSTPKGGVYLTSGSVDTRGINGTAKWDTLTDGNLGANDATAGTDDIRTFEVQTCSYQSSTPYGVHLYEVYSDDTAAAVRYGTSGNNDLKYSTSYNKITIGGFEATNANLSSMEGLVVLKVAIYASASAFPLTTADLSNYEVPYVYNYITSSTISTANGYASQLEQYLSYTGDVFVNMANDVALTIDAAPASNLVFPSIAANTLTIGDNDVDVATVNSAVAACGFASALSCGTGSIVIEGSSAAMSDAVSAIVNDAEKWTGTVWLKNRTGWANFDPTAYGNAGSTLRFSGIQGHFAKKKCLLANTPKFELENDSYDYALNLNNGYSFNSNGGWSYVHTSTLSGSGTLLCNGSGGALLVVASNWSNFTGKLNMTNKTVWFGYTDAPADTTDLTPGTVAAGVRLNNVTLNIAQPWILNNTEGGFFGTGTVNVAASSTGSTDTSISLISTSLDITINLAGLSGKHHILPFDNHTIAATINLDGAVTINSGSTGKTYTFSKLTGAGNFTNTFAENFVFNDVTEYTGTLASSGNNITVGVPTAPAVGDLIAKVDSTNNKVSTAITVGSEGAKAIGELTTVGEVYGLYATARATINETGYTTLAQAIENASEGDTITLSSDATEAVLTIAKNLTIDFNGKAADLGGIVINEGKTLTVTRANSNSNVIPTITGGGNLVVSGNNTFAWKGMAGTSSLASITQNNASGGISIAGCGTINVSGGVSVTSTLTLTPDSATTTTISNGWTIKLVANSLTAGTLAGAGRIETTDGVIAKTSGFYGSFAGAGDVTLNADSTITAPSYFGTGKLAVADGKTLTISPYDYSDKIKFGFDASNTANWLFKEDDATSVTSVIYTVESTSKSGRFNSYGTTSATYKSSDADYFGGAKPFVLFSNGCDYSVANTKSNPGYYNSLAWLFVYQKNDETNTQLMKEKSGEGYLKVASAAWSFKRYNSMLNDYLMVNGVKSTAFTAGEASTVAMLTRPTANNNRFDALVSDNTIAVAEAIGFKAVPSVEEYLAINAALQHKWNLVGKTASQFIPTTASVELGSGSTLDLGGYTQTVASFTGGGTVQNGTLLTASNVYTNNGALAIAAVDNMTIVLDAGATALTLTGDATGVKLTATDAFLASGGTVTVTATDIYNASHTIDISEFPSTIFRFGATDNNDGTLTIGAATSGFTAATYTWSPVGSSTDWTSLANWSVSGYNSVSVLPQSVDTVIFPTSAEPAFTGWTVVLGENRVVNTVQFNANTTLSGGMFYAQGVSGGSGVVVTLGNSAGFANNGSNLTISLTMVVTAEEATPARFYSSDTQNSVNNKIILGAESKVTGSGYVKFNAGYDHYGSCVVEIRGDMTEFEGHVIIANGEGGSHRENTYMTSYGQSAYWTINNSSRAGSRPDLFGSQTYYFGSLTGSPSHYGNTTFTLEIGNLNQNDTLGGSYCRTTYAGFVSTGGGTIRKVGTGTMTFSGSSVHAYEVNAGTLYITSEKSLRTYWDSTSATSYTDTYSDEDHAYYPTITFGGESGGTLKLADDVEWDVSAQLRSASQPVRFETAVDRTWATALEASNTALVKSGAGTLTLSAAPAYTGDFEISVEAGKVVVPNTATNTKPAKGTKCTAVDGNYVYERGDDALSTGETEEKTGLADQDAADDLAHSYNVTLNESQETQGLKSSYYKVIATATATEGTYTMSVVLDEDEVGVDFGEEDDTVEPVVFTGSAPTFQLKECVKKGLYYGVGTITDPTAANPTVTVLAEQQATADGQEISLTPTLDFSSGNVIYYKLSVSDTAQTTP